MHSVVSKVAVLVQGRATTGRPAVRPTRSNRRGIGVRGELHRAARRRRGAGQPAVAGRGDQVHPASAGRTAGRATCIDGQHAVAAPERALGRGGCKSFRCRVLRRGRVLLAHPATDGGPDRAPLAGGESDRGRRHAGPAGRCRYSGRLGRVLATHLGCSAGHRAQVAAGAGGSARATRHSPPGCDPAAGFDVVCAPGRHAFCGGPTRSVPERTPSAELHPVPASGR